MDADIEKVSELLGGRKVLGKKLCSTFELIPLLRKGLPYGAFEAVTSALDMSTDAACESLRLTRRKPGHRKGQVRLSAQESERVVRLAHIAAHASLVVASLDNAKLWLTASNRALEGVAPITMLDTDVGARAVEDVLLRIEYGVYS
jgi:putative toxin-antitoxin system antitoxin component (TIGR02293 family)